MRRILITRRVPQEVFSRLSKHFDVEMNTEDTVWSSSELAARLPGIWGCFTFLSERIDGAFVDSLPSKDLKVISQMAVGTNNLNIEELKQRGIVVSNTPDVLTECTADLAFSLLMATARRLTEAETFLREGKWSKWSFDLLCGKDVFGAKIGVVGAGAIGRAVIRRATRGFQMQARYFNRNQLDIQIEKDHNMQFEPNLDELLSWADFIVLTVPYTKETHHLIGKSELLKMRTDSILINVARGGVIDDSALVDALCENRIGGAGLDVFENEPQVNPGLLKLRSKVVLTPHIGSATLKTRTKMANVAADNLISFHERGELINLVMP